MALNKIVYSLDEVGAVECFNDVSVELNKCENESEVRRNPYRGIGINKMISLPGNKNDDYNVNVFVRAIKLLFEPEVKVIDSFDLLYPDNKRLSIWFMKSLSKEADDKKGQMVRC
jgi:hypothetical protein